jgi:hypothetical protein
VVVPFIGDIRIATIFVGDIIYLTRIFILRWLKNRSRSWNVFLTVSLGETHGDIM